MKRKIKQKNITKKRLLTKLKTMRIEFLESAIKKEAFSYQALGDFRRRLKKLKRK